MKNFKQRVSEGERLVGTLITLGSAEVIELLSYLPFDFLWIDAEHSPSGFAEIQAMLQAVAGRLPVVVRVPGHDLVWIKKVLDMGCNGIIIPQVNTAEQARQIIEACYYPPTGVRSVGATRAHHYGFNSSDYLASANDSIAVILQIEHNLGLSNANEICQVDGADAVFIGPIDLSASLGVLGKMDHPELKAAVSRICATCQENNRAIGTYARDRSGVEVAFESGISFVGLGTDAGLLRKAASDLINAVKKS